MGETGEYRSKEKEGMEGKRKGWRCVNGLEGSVGKEASYCGEKIRCSRGRKDLRE